MLATTPMDQIYFIVVRTGIEPVISHLDAYSTLGVSDLVRLPTRHLTIKKINLPIVTYLRFSYSPINHSETFVFIFTLLITYFFFGSSVNFVVKVGLEPNTVQDGLDNLITSLVQRVMDSSVFRTWDHPALRPLDYLPHFTRLMDWLPYGSGGFLLFQDSVVRARIELAARGFSVHCSTY